VKAEASGLSDLWAVLMALAALLLPLLLAWWGAGCGARRATKASRVTMAGTGAIPTDS
jgi:hypothetical protein